MSRFDDLRTGDDLRPPDLRVEEISDFAAAQPDDPGWLARPIWPADAYGVIGATWKAGKTWIVCDLVISVASAGTWLGAWPTPARRVLVFLSEGGRRKMARRLRAVADAKGVDLAGLPIRLSLRAPRIVNLLELAALEDEIETHRPGLIVLDPWYLSAPGVKMADLVRVGEVLAHLQDIAQAAGAALVITHHWNQTGQGTGAERLSGAGMAEWGRVLVSVNVASLQTSDGSSNAVLAVNVVGDEIAPRDVVVRRHVQVLGDPDDLTAPLTYTCQPSDVPVGLLGHSSARDRVLAVLSRQPDDWLDSLQIGDILAGWGIPLTAKSIRRAAAELVDDKAIDETEASRGRKQWSAQ